ncbi:MAG: MobA/MobL family protein, partial [Pontixanthobacter sp.]
MALARLSMKFGKVGKAAAHAAYIAREAQYARRLHHGEGLEAKETGNLPAWADTEPNRFWQAADTHERANGTTYREMEIALPRELTPAQRLALVRGFVQQELGERHAYQWAIHNPQAADGHDQPHVHLMFSERQTDGIDRDPNQYFRRHNPKAPEKGGAKKGYGPYGGGYLSAAERVAHLKGLRQRWEIACNAALAHAGRAERIDMRSHLERGLTIPPERKQLPSAWRQPETRAVVLAFRQARAERA